jgi:predicted ATP-grasp superfamily ATP-dependent carboligase
MVLDGDYDNAIQVATEVSTDLDATVIGVGTSTESRLLCSKYCDVGETVPTTGDGYAEALLEVVREHRPDVVVPVGYRSLTTIDAVRDRLPHGVESCVPPSRALAMTVDKRRTLELASELGIDTPDDYTAAAASADERRPEAVRDLPYPMFLKARHECGENATAVVDDASSFWPTYEELAERADDEVLVQEYIDGPRTYACGVLFVDGSLEMLFEHEERRSVPRRGGSGTRVRIFRDPKLEVAALELLRALDWSGFALVEFKRADDGTFVLMEINPKLWASYALASQSGYRFVSRMVAETLDIPWTGPERPDQTGEMVFPLRELYFALTNADESLVRAAATMLWPPAQWDLHLHDFRSWFTFPTDQGETEADASQPTGGASVPDEDGPASGDEGTGTAFSSVDPRTEHD